MQYIVILYNISIKHVIDSLTILQLKKLVIKVNFNLSILSKNDLTNENFYTIKKNLKFY